MRVVFVIPAEQTTSGRAELATYRGQLLIATNADEIREVPDSWLGIDLDRADGITVTEWLETLRD